jgi:restriction endonuclease S subunit
MPKFSYIKFKDIKEAHRYDADYFKPEYLNKISILKNNSVPLGKFMLKGNYGILPKSEDYGKGNTILIRGGDLRGDLLDLENLIKVPDLYFNEKYDVKINDILILVKGATIANSDGVILCHQNFSKCIFNGSVFRVRLNEKINPFFVYLFMTTKYFTFQKEREVANNGIEYNSLQTIKDYKIPLLDEKFQDSIESFVKTIYQKQEESKRIYNEAEELLLSELGLLDFKPQNDLTFSATKKEIEKAHRFDSEYFEPKYDDIIERIEKYSGGWDLVKKAINFKDKNFGLKTDQKYKYLALSNISNQGYVTDYQEELGKDLPSRARRKINTGDVIISSIEGSLSSCAIIEEEFDNAICSTGFFVVNSEKINPETLLILFKSNIIQELLIRGSKGTILTAISKSEIESIKIPLLKKTIQDKIAEKITKSHKLRKESKELLESAKKMVEEEIEKSK